MNKKIVIVVVAVLAVVALGAGAVFLQTQTSPRSDQSQARLDSSSQPANKQAESMRSIKDLFGSVVEQECSIRDQGTGATGTVRTKGGRVRGDFVSSVDGQSSNTHILVSENVVYIWMDEPAGLGVKMAVKDYSDADKPGQAKQQAGMNVDLTKEVDIKCTRKSIDESVFVLPKNVQFTDMSNMLEKTKNPGGGAGGGGSMVEPKSVCDSCKGLVGEAQAQCKSALNCP